MTDIYLHGIETIEKNNGPQPVATIDTGIIGLVGTAPNADAVAWPINTPVAVHGYQGEITNLGTTGTLVDAIEGIFDQATRASQTIVVVRVNDDADPNIEMANVLGNSLTKTGMHALLRSQPELNLKPKLLIAPGFTSTRPSDGVGSVVVTAGGTGYPSGATRVTASGDGTGFQATATVDAGVVTGITVTNPGYGYSTAPTLTVTGGGDGATATAQVAGGVITQILVTNGGENYEGSPTVTITDGTGSGATATAVVTNGAITAINVTNGGTLYSGTPSVEISNPVGSGATATANLGYVANPVAVELLTVANRLRAGVIVDGPNTTNEAAVSYRLDFNATRPMLIVDPHCKVSKNGSIVAQPVAARVAGLQARVDYDEGFWVSPSNHVIEGIVGAARPIEHSLHDPSAESQYLNKNEVATIVRSPSGGYKLWGSRNPNSDGLNAFWSVRRAHDTIIESIELAHEPFIDKPFGLQVLLDIAETVNSALRRWQALGATLGGRVWLDPSLNTKETWVSGHLYISYDAEAPAPIEHITFMFSRNTGYYEVLADNVVREIERLSGRVL